MTKVCFLSTARRFLTDLQIAVVFGPHNMALEVAANDLSVHYFVTTLPEHPAAMHFTYYLLPRHDAMHRAALDVMKRFRWQEDKIGIMYDNHQGQ